MPDLLKKVTKLNHYTVENSVLQSLVDDDGYLTVYQGLCARTTCGAYSWTFDKAKALENGYLFAAIINERPDFYCVTGKVKLADVITFIDGHSIHEITALPQRIINQSREFFNTEDYRMERTRME